MAVEAENPNSECAAVIKKAIKAGTKSTLHLCYFGWVGVYFLSPLQSQMRNLGAPT
jgi:hypothetical protein